jgi:hypothetical protein
LWRLDPLDRPRHQCALAAFCFLLKMVSEKEVPTVGLQAHLYHAAARHYDIPAELLDWTIDPTLAISFANSVTNPGEECAVYFTNYEYHPDFRLILPPPFAKRLFRERAFFHFTTDETDNERLFHSSAKITFPANPEFELPSSYPMLDQLHIPDELLVELVDVAYEIAGRVPADHFAGLDDSNEEVKRTTIERLAAEFLDISEDLATRHRFSRQLWDALIQNWILEIHRFFNELFTFHASNDSEFVAINSVFDSIQLNRDALDVYCNWMLSQERAKFQSRKPFFRELRRRLDAEYPELRSRQGHIEA